MFNILHVRIVHRMMNYDDDDDKYVISKGINILFDPKKTENDWAMLLSLLKVKPAPFAPSYGVDIVKFVLS